MTEARTGEAWLHTAALLALQANIHRDPRKSAPFRPADFHPHLRQKPVVSAKVGIGVLKQIFVDRPGGSADGIDAGDPSGRGLR